jgi:hypothetical protein
MSDYDFDELKRKRIAARAEQENLDAAREATFKALLADLRDALQRNGLVHGAEVRGQSDGAILQRDGDSLRVIMRADATYDIVENGGVEVEKIDKDQMMNRVLDFLEKP